MSAKSEGLNRKVAQLLRNRKLIVVSNREPYIHSYDGEDVRCDAPVSGLVTGLEPIMCATGGTWVAHGSGDADSEVVDERDCVPVPPTNPRYSLKRVWLTKRDEEGYYYGFANQGLWPLCHQVYSRPRFSLSDWHAYEEVNRKFADAILEEVGSEPAWVFLQDYHLALVPKMLKEQRPDLLLTHFWHIPWPSPEVFATCPWGKEILEGLLSNDLLGFQIQQHCDNFLSTVEQSLESAVSREDFAVNHQGHRTLVKAFPISVDFEAISTEAQSPEVLGAVEPLRRQLGLRNQVIGVGVDRLDYTKGIPERFLAIDRFLEKYPQYQKRFTFVQLGPVSRIHIDEYKALNDELYHLMVEINRKYAGERWVPIRLLKANHPHHTLWAFFQLADLCIVSSLHDGMNLVAKEFVSARPDRNGALVLSQFAGAAQELSSAITVNPFDTEGFADALKYALEMPLYEKTFRMARMRRQVAQSTIYDWVAGLISELSHLDEHLRTESEYPSFSAMDVGTGY